MDYKIFDGTTWVNPCKRPFGVLDKNLTFQDIDPKLKEIYYYNGGWKLMDCTPDPSGLCIGFGYLYNSDVFATDGLSFANGSWRVPTKADWDALLAFPNDALRSKGLIIDNNGVWDGMYAGATNALMFTSLPGGLRDGFANFNHATSSAYYWTSTTHSGDATRFVVKVQEESSSTFTEIDAFIRGNGASIRLVRAASTPELAIPDGKTSENSALLPYTGNDGTVYPTVKIGSLIWTRENLRETKFTNGTLITKSQTKDEWIVSFTNETPAYCEYSSDVTPVLITSKDSDTEICSVPVPIPPKTLVRTLCRCGFGYNYNKFATQDSRFGNGSGVFFPFSVASKLNWVTLFLHVGGNQSTSTSYYELWQNVGDKLKCLGRDGTWHGDNDYNLNLFSHIVRDAYLGIPGAIQGKYSHYSTVEGAYFHTSDNWMVKVHYSSNSMDLEDVDQAAGITNIHGYPVRLVRPATPFELSLADGYASDGIKLPCYFGNDNKLYFCVKIGTQIWVAENSRETKWNDNTSINYCDDNHNLDFYQSGAMSLPAYGYPESLTNFSGDPFGENQDFLDGIEPCDAIV